MFHALLLDLNLTNRPVRTRMPGGVGGAAEPRLGSPIPIALCWVWVPSRGARDQLFSRTTPNDLGIYL